MNIGKNAKKNVHESWRMTHSVCEYLVEPQISVVHKSFDFDFDLFANAITNNLQDHKDKTIENKTRLSHKFL